MAAGGATDGSRGGGGAAGHAPCPQTGRTALGRTPWRQRRTSPSPVPRPVGRTHASLERALEVLATHAAYDLRDEHGVPTPKMLWHYQVVRAEAAGAARSTWPDGVPGQHYTPMLLVLDNERLGRPYADEAEYNQLPAVVRSALGPVPLLVRIQYMNMCHALNGAAAMALVRHGARRGVAWTVGGVPVADIGWVWGEAPGDIGLTVTQAQTDRVRHQAHAHQTVAFRLDDGTDLMLDLSVAQFGDDSAIATCARSLQPPPSAGCALSPTLARRAEAGIAPALFAEVGGIDGDTAGPRHLLGDGRRSRRPRPHCRLSRDQRAVEAALAAAGTRPSHALAAQVRCPKPRLPHTPRPSPSHTPAPNPDR